IRLGRYEVIRHIATGGMGAVYHARDPETGRDVAIKVLPQEMAARPGALDRFRREALHAARLRHENIVTLHEFGEDKNVHFLVLEYVDGTDLQEYVTRKGQLDPKDARFIAGLAGQPPFPEGGLVERLYKHCHEEPPDVRDFNPRVPGWLADVLRRMLAKDPADRFQTPKDLLQALVHGEDESTGRREVLQSLAE